MNVSKKMLGCFLFASLVCYAAAADEFVYESGGKRYVVRITEAQQAHCPQWDPKDQPNPPYPAAKALAQAEKFMASFPKPFETNFFSKISWHWKFEELALVKLSGGWAWRASYVPLPRRGSGSTFVTPMCCWILMDGTLAEPKITADKR